jgi:Mn2+/Fe2+ NRAMP family transporter
MSLVAGIILYIGLYNVLEKVSLVMVGIMLIAVVVCAVAVMTGQSWGEFVMGLMSIGKIPSGALKDALPLLGWSGEGAIGTILYAAWVQERGHGIKLGKDVTKDTPYGRTDQRRKAWHRVIKTDLSIIFLFRVWHASPL